MKSIRMGLLAAFSLLAAGALGQAKEAKETIVIWGLSNSANEKGTDALVRAFEERNPKYKVRLLGMGAGGMNPQKLMTAIVGKAPPDIIRQDRFNVNDWASRGAFLPLDSLIARDASDPLTPKPEQYYPAAWNEGIYEGQIYSIPLDANVRVFYWNKAVFQREAARLRAAGLDPNRPPRTWSELRRYNRVLTQFNPDKTLKSVGFMPDFGASGLYGAVIQNGGSYLSPDGKRATFDTPEVTEALNFLLEEYKFMGGVEKTNAFWTASTAKENNAYTSGSVAMVITGEWELTWLHKKMPTFEFGAAPIPVPDDRFYRRGRFKDVESTFATWIGGYGFAIPTGAKNVNGAWEFIKFATSLEGRKIELLAQQDLYKSRGERFFPNIQGQKAAAAFQAKQFASGDSPFDEAYRTHVKAMDYAVARRSTFAAQAVFDAQIRLFDQTVNKRMTPQEAQREANITTQKILNEFFYMKEMPLADLKTPTYVAMGAVILFFAGFTFWVARQVKSKMAMRETLAGYAFVAPWILGFLIFTFGPMLASLYLSFTVYNVLSEPRWVGFQNYIDIFQRDIGILSKGFANVFYMAGMGIPIGNGIGLAVALLLNTNVKGMKFYRTMFYLPSILPGVGAVVLWAWLLDPNPDRGFVNGVWAQTIAHWFGVPAPTWFGSEHWAKPSLLLMGAWGAGSGFLLWLAGLKGISNTLYEAADIDGASGWQKFVSVTIPQLTPLIFFNIVMSVIGAIQSFDTVYLVTGGNAAGPGDSLMMPVLLLFQNGFGYFRMGYASALAWFIFAIILGLTFFNMWWGKMWVHSEVKS